MLLKKLNFYSNIGNCEFFISRFFKKPQLFANTQKSEIKISF